ncbi:unnamed protein product, partial [Chrysoparadoxa australica]
RDDTEGHFKGRAGEILGDNFVMGEDVGTGTFGRVAECWDRKKSRSVAVKIVRKVRKYYESAQIEADILRDVNKRGGAGLDLCVKMYDSFNHHGHYCLVFEKLGSSLYDLMVTNNYKGLPLYCVRSFSLQLLQAMEFLHSIDLIHTDLKLENVLLVSGALAQLVLPDGATMKVPVTTRVKVIDFGGATYSDEQKGSIINTRQYRGPEVTLGMGWSFPSDLWSVGCIVAELYLGDLLFATHNSTEHLALMERIIGPFPKHMAQSSKASKFFTSNGQTRWKEDCDRDMQRHLIAPPDGGADTEESSVKQLASLLRRLLALDPRERVTAKGALRHDFF